MARPHDEAFFSLMESERAIVRLIAPRRTGKTELVGHFARESRTPLLLLSINPLPSDLPSASPVILAMLRREIDALALTSRHRCSELHDAYAAMVEKERRPLRKRTLGVELGNAAIGKLSASSETSVPAASEATADADVEIARILRRLELAAEETNIRPVVFFDEAQEMILHASRSGMATLWAIRNEIQHHTACRYVFAGSNQRLFASLQSGSNAPLLNLGTSLELKPLTIAEIDAWAKPLFEAGQRHVRTLAAATELLCGKIGEVVEVCNWLWSHTAPNDILDEAIQREAVLATARNTSPEPRVKNLTPAQTTVLRWVLAHPGASPFEKPALQKTALNPGTVKNALTALVDAELVESFSSTSYSCTTPLRTLAALAPDTWYLTDTPEAASMPLPQPRATSAQKSQR